MWPLKQERLLDVEEADGILYTEYKIHSREEWDTKCPTVIIPRYVRAAQMFSTAFEEVGGNFAIAGLLRFIDVRKFKNWKRNMVISELFFAYSPNYDLKEFIIKNWCKNVSK